MSFEQLIRNYLSKQDLDIRKKSQGYSRYMDQKVTPDVVTFIADCIQNFLGTNTPYTLFSAKDIWEFSYFQKNIVTIFGKPSPTNEKADAEYDKFIAQPLKTLFFANILKEEKIGRRNTYQVKEPELLEYISQNERNAWIFIATYVEKVLNDSGFLNELDSFKDKSLSNTVSQEDFELLKTKFESFMRGYTEINSLDDIRRIFPKVINPYSVLYGINGSVSGKMSQHRFIYSDLMYNRGNFRDLGKDKALTRSEAEKIMVEEPEFVTYKVQKAKGIIKRNHSNSEVHDSLALGEATQVHHIFPEHEFPQISDYVENLILLTPQQHNTKAHPSNNTKLVSRDYQRECLLSKIDSIEISIKKGKDVYSKESLIHVLNTGLLLNMSTNVTFDELKDIIKKSYA